MNKLIEEIKVRKIRKWLAIYVSTGITIVGVTNLISTRYNWSTYIFDIILFTLLFGIAGVIVFAWFHGKEGKQKIKLMEIVLQTILFIGLIVTLYYGIDFGKKKIDTTNRKVIAVLPFTDFNETKENEFFADGITDDILTQLSKISDLKVISRTSVMKYKKTSMNISDIAKELGAGTILEGSVRTLGNKIRIVSQLIDAANDVHIWSETYDRELSDIFKVQSEISEEITAALHSTLLPLEKEQIGINRTDNIDAYIYYLKGKHEYFKYSKNDNEKAIEFFKMAINIDSNYALAYAGLAEAYGQRVLKYSESKEWFDSAMVLSKRALSINPSIPEVYKALATAYSGLGKNNLAMSNYKKAIKLNPNYWDAILNYGQMLLSKSQYDEAFYWISRAHRLAPDNIAGMISLSMAYKNLDCYNEAISWANKAILLQPNHTFNTLLNYYLSELYLNIGDHSNAYKFFNKTIELDSNYVSSWYLGGRIETVAGNYKMSKKYFEKNLRTPDSYPEYFYAFVLLKLNEIDSAKVILANELEIYKEYFETETPGSNFDFIAFAEIYSILNEKENAFKWWKKAIDNNYIDIKRVQQYPYFENIKNDHMYKSMILLMQNKIDSYKNNIRKNYPDFKICE